MSLIIRQALAKNAQEKRAMQAQWNHVQELRNAGDPAMQAFLQITNAGRSPAEAYREFDATTKIEVKRMTEVNKRKAVTLRGEVLGIAGLVGAGRTEAMRALYGVDYISGGSVYVKGKKLRASSPRAAKEAGIAFLTEDRKDEGLTIDFSVKSNIVMANLRKIAPRLFIRNGLENKLADQYIQAIRIKTPSRAQKVLNLSGGNQQKVVIAKWFNTDSDIIIMDEPTRGIDVGAKYEIYEIINDLVSHGKAVIMISSELPEILGMSDRVLVMKNDAFVAELTGERISAVDIMNYAF